MNEKSTGRQVEPDKSRERKRPLWKKAIATVGAIAGLGIAGFFIWAVISGIAALSFWAIVLVILVAKIYSPLKGLAPTVVWIVILILVLVTLKSFLMGNTDPLKKILGVGVEKSVEEMRAELPPEPSQTITKYKWEKKSWCPEDGKGDCRDIAPHEKYGDFVAPPNYRRFTWSGKGRWCDGTKWEDGKCVDFMHGSNKWHTREGLLAPIEGHPFRVIAGPQGVKDLRFTWQQRVKKEVPNPRYQQQVAVYQAAVAEIEKKTGKKEKDGDEKKKTLLMWLKSNWPFLATIIGFIAIVFFLLKRKKELQEQLEQEREKRKREAQEESDR